MTTQRPLHLIPFMLIIALLMTSLPRVSRAAPPHRAAVTRLELVKTIGKGYVTELAYHPTTEQIAVAGGGGAYLYDADALQPRHLDHDYEPVRAAAYTPDGRHLVTLSQNANNQGTVWVWDTTSGDLAQQWLLDDLGLSLAISPDGQRAYIGTDAGEVQVWSLPAVTLLTTLTRLDANHTAVTSLALSPDGQALLASIGFFSPLWVVWDVATGEKVLDVLGPHRTDIDAVAYSADGASLFTQSNDIVNVWDSTTGRLLGDIPYLGASILSMALSPDGQEIALAQADGIIRRWSLATQSELLPLEGTLATALAYSPDSQRLLSADTDGPLLEWDLALPSPAVVDMGYFSSGIVGPTLSPDGRYLGMVFNTTFWLWDAEGGGPIARLERDTMLGTRAVYNPSSDLLAVFDSRGLDVYSLPDLEPVLHIDPLRERDYPVGATFDSTGALLVGFAEGDVVRYSLPDGTPTPLTTYESRYQRIGISPDGLWAVGVTVDRRLRFWHTIDYIPAFETSYVRAERVPFTISADSQWVVNTTSTGLILRTLSDGDAVFIAAAHDPFGTPIFTPSLGHVLVLFDGTATLYETQGGQERYMAGFPMGVVWAAFDLTHNQFWTLGADSIVYVWQLPAAWR